MSQRVLTKITIQDEASGPLKEISKMMGQQAKEAKKLNKIMKKLKEALSQKKAIAAMQRALIADPESKQAPVIRSEIERVKRGPASRPAG